MVLQGIRVGEVDAVRLVRILRDVGEMEAEGLTETAELDLTLVLQAELECLLSNLLFDSERKSAGKQFRSYDERVLRTWYMISNLALFLSVSRAVP